jgi:hypothetical protein
MLTQLQRQEQQQGPHQQPVVVAAALGQLRVRVLEGALGGASPASLDSAP